MKHSLSYIALHQELDRLYSWRCSNLSVPQGYSSQTLRYKLHGQYTANIVLFLSRWNKLTVHVCSYATIINHHGTNYIDKPMYPFTVPTSGAIPKNPDAWVSTINGGEGPGTPQMEGINQRGRVDHCMDLEDLDVDTLQCYAWFADSTIMVGVLETIWELHTLILMYTYNSCHCYCDHCTWIPSDLWCRWMDYLVKPGRFVV